MGERHCVRVLGLLKGPSPPSHPIPPSGLEVNDGKRVLYGCWDHGGSPLGLGSQERAQSPGNKPSVEILSSWNWLCPACPGVGDVLFVLGKVAVFLLVALVWVLLRSPL